MNNRTQNIFNIIEGLSDRSFDANNENDAADYISKSLGIDRNDIEIFLSPRKSLTNDITYFFIQKSKHKRLGEFVHSKISKKGKGLIY